MLIGFISVIVQWVVRIVSCKAPKDDNKWK